MASEAKHTPGPWLIETSDRMGPTPFITAESGHRIAQLEWNELNSPRAHGTANARLIAAAPELLEALRGMLLATDHWNNFEPGAKEREVARAAHTKATA